MFFLFGASGCNTHCVVGEEDMAPLILHIEEDKEDTDHHGDNNADNVNQATVHPAAREQLQRLSPGHHGILCK